MSGLAIKDVRFNGATLRAARDTENIIWVGVAWVCQGLGLSDGQMKNERKKIQTDEVLSQGTKFHPLGFGNSDSEVLCLKLDFLPLWLAKIHVTPKMRRDNPQLADKLNTYQLKAKDVLASVFLNKNALTPQRDYIKQIAKLQIAIEEMRQENRKMYKDISTIGKNLLRRIHQLNLLFLTLTCIHHGKKPCIRRWIVSAPIQRNLASAPMLCVGFIST